MIAELFLILDLLGDDVYFRTTKADTPIVSTRPTKQVVIPPISPNQFNQWYLDAIEGIPITSLPYTGKR
jgi:hypothetical protein